MKIKKILRWLISLLNLSHSRKIPACYRISLPLAQLPVVGLGLRKSGLNRSLTHVFSGEPM